MTISNLSSLKGSAKLPTRASIVTEFFWAFLSVFSTALGSISEANTFRAHSWAAKIAKTPVPQPTSMTDISSC